GGGMWGWGSDIAEPHQRIFWQSGEEALRGAVGAAIVHPFRHAAHGARRPIAIVNLERESRARKVRLHSLERSRDVLPENALCRLVAGQRPADEIVESGVTNILGDARVHVAQINKTGGQRALRPCMFPQREKCDRDRGGPRSKGGRFSAIQSHAMS